MRICRYSITLTGVGNYQGEITKYYSIVGNVASNTKEDLSGNNKESVKFSDVIGNSSTLKNSDTEQNNNTIEADKAKENTDTMEKTTVTEDVNTNSGNQNTSNTADSLNKSIWDDVVAGVVSVMLILIGLYRKFKRK